MKTIPWSAIAGLLLFLCASCAASQTIFKSADVMKLHAGMVEKEIVAILHTNPSSRSFYFNDGTYLLRWNNSDEMRGGGDIRCLAILFREDGRMITIVDQENFTSE